MGALSKTTITSNEATDAFDLSQVASDACFQITGATGGTVTPEYCNLPAADRKESDWNPAPVPYSSFPSGPWRIPFGFSNYVRFKAAGVTGTARVSFGPVKNAKGDVVQVSTELPPQSQVTA